jgi:hypothetical protein
LGQALCAHAAVVVDNNTAAAMPKIGRREK